jgi:hypothetical protein
LTTTNPTESADASGRSAPPPAIFVNEDLGKPENRTNLALLNTLQIPAFRYWFLGRLGLPPDCVIYPPQSVDGLRPDFVVRGPDRKIVAWIEVELRGEDTAQLNAYRKTFPEAVKSIVGPRDAAVDLSLDELADVVSSRLFASDEQHLLTIEMFRSLVDAKTAAQSWAYVEPTDALRALPFVQQLSQHLPGVLEFGVPPGAISKGRLLVATTTQRGWTLRAPSTEPTLYRSVSLMWSPGGLLLRVPSKQRLLKFLPERADAVEAYANFLEVRFGLDLSSLAEAQSHGLQESALVPELDEFAERVRALVI